MSLHVVSGKYAALGHVRPLSSMDNDTHLPPERINSLNPRGVTCIINKTGHESLPVSSWIRQRFMQHYRAIVAIAANGPAGGFSVVGLGEGEEIAHVGRVIKENKSTNIIVGRHPSCHLVLKGDATVSLRHLLIRAVRHKGQRTQFKIIDLHSEAGFFDESGMRVSALNAQGLFFIKVGNFAIFIFPNNRMPGESEPGAAWNSLPSREIIEMRTPPQGREKPNINPRLRLVTSDEKPITFITRITGALHLGNLSRDDPRAIGFLLIEGAGVDASIPLSASELSCGVLIGRYLRCDIGYDAIPFSTGVSRIQLLLLLDETGLWAIDTGSTNGNLFNDSPFQAVLMTNGGQISMANEYILRWRSV